MDIFHQAKNLAQSVKGFLLPIYAKYTPVCSLRYAPFDVLSVKIHAGVSAIGDWKNQKSSKHAYTWRYRVVPVAATHSVSETSPPPLHLWDRVLRPHDNLSPWRQSRLGPCPSHPHIFQRESLPPGSDPVHQDLRVLFKWGFPWDTSAVYTGVDKGGPGGPGSPNRRAKKFFS